MIILIQCLVLLISVVLHEIAHAYVAYLYGDPTAKRLGRLSLNPLVHLDVIGSFILPALCIVSGAPFFIGWAKPVPVDTGFFKDPQKHMMWVALAGPMTNLSLAFLGSLFLNIMVWTGLFSAFWTGIFILLIQINLVLMIFNLLPIPPLDGSRIIIPFLPQGTRSFVYKLEPYGFACIFLLAYFGLFSSVFNVFLPPLFRVFIPFSGV